MRKGRKRPKPWRETLYQDDNGCMLVQNIPNQDGYIRVNGGDYSESKLIMLHVLRWRQLVGDIPEGMEINHKCGNRGCCNVEHLELIDGSAHATLTNKNRVGYTKQSKQMKRLQKFIER